MIAPTSESTRAADPDGADGRVTKMETPEPAGPPDAPAFDRASHGQQSPTHFGFVIAGVQKAGTTSLYWTICAHDQIAPAKRKELHFFDNEKVDWSNPPYERYHQKIQERKSAVLAGEASPRYLFWPGALERMRAYNPEMRIILSFRDPIERAFSHWTMSAGKRDWKWNFSETIRRGRDSGWPRSRQEYGRNTAKTIVARGYYGAQLAHALEVFPEQQFLLLDFHRLFANLEKSLDRVTRFLGVQPFAKPPDIPAANTSLQNLVARPPTADDISALAELYVDDLAKFADLSGIDVSTWPTMRLRAGTLSPAEVASRMSRRASLVSPAPNVLRKVTKPDVASSAEPITPAASE